MKTIGQILMSIIIVIAIIGCDFDVNNTQPKENVSVDPSILAKLNRIGFTTNNIVDRGDLVIVEDDIAILKKHLEGISLSKSTQWRTYNLVSATNATNVRLQIHSSISSWTSLIQSAINVWNNEISNLKFTIVNSEPDITIYSDLATEIPDDYRNFPYYVGAMASWPYLGKPGNIVSINIDCIYMDTEMKKISTLAHELGHCIGFRHTNWQGNENADPEGAVLIPDTRETDAESLMNGGMLGTERTLSPGDKNSLHCLYPSTSFFSTGIKADRIYWCTSVSNGNIITKLSNFTINSIETSGSTSSSTSFFFSDINGDGKSDKLYWNPSNDGGQIRLYLATVSGAFSATYSLSAGSSNSSTRFYFADVNGDGKSDKIYWNPSVDGGQIRVYLANSSGTFNSNYSLSTGSSNSTTRFYFANVDGSSGADKIYWNPTVDNGQVRVYLANGMGSFNTTYSLNVGSTSSSTYFYFADIDNDGDADKFYWNPTVDNGQIRTYLSNGNGTFTSSYVVSLGSANTATKFYFADVTGDGRADKLYWNYTVDDGLIRIYAAQNGNFDTNYLFIAGSTNSSTQFYFTNVD
jgi:hypothetical protein